MASDEDIQLGGWYSTSNWYGVLHDEVWRYLSPGVPTLAHLKGPASEPIAALSNQVVHREQTKKDVPEHPVWGG